MAAASIEFPIQSVEPWTVALPIEPPETDGTLRWSSTDVVLVAVAAGGQVGIGYSYADASVARLVGGTLAPALLGRDALDTAGAFDAQVAALRNLGAEGHAFRAVSAVDVALWDLKARLLSTSVAKLLGARRASVPVYGSGGFTSLTVEQLCRQLAGWAELGIGSVKMKVGTDPASDPTRVRAARAAVGDEVALFVDANGAYAVKQATALAQRFAEAGVSWFEEPVPQARARELRLLRRLLPPGMELATGEYITTLESALALLSIGAVDVLQADATRCGGFTGFLRVAVLCEAAGLPLSAHTAPALHAYLGCAWPLRHVEYFHDHVRAEAALFDGVPVLREGCLAPLTDVLGLGLTPKSKEAPHGRGR